MHKNRILGNFSIDGVEVKSFLLNSKYLNYLPLPLKSVLNNKAYFDDVYTLNENGCLLLYNWLCDRTIPFNRIGYNRYISKASDKLLEMLSMYAVSLTDCYWVKPKDELIDWETIKLYNSSKIDSFDMVDYTRRNNEMYSSINLTTNGVLEKYWFLKEDKVMLAKRTSLSNEILNIREIIASKIYEKQGLLNSARYNYIYNREHRIVGCTCNILTSESRELVTAYDLLSEYGLAVKGRNSICDLERCLQGYSAPRFVFDALYKMFLIDYLITNRDRHLNNIAFIRDSESLNILDIAIFDNGSSEYVEGVSPEESLSTTINGIEDTEYEILCKLPRSCFNTLDLSLLPTNQWVKEQIEKAENLSSFRKNFLFELYKEKKKILRGLQKSNSSVEEYIKNLVDFNKFTL